MKKFIQGIKCFFIKAFVTGRKNKPKKHKHIGEEIRREEMRGTNRYIEGKEIEKKIYRYDWVCKDCGETIERGTEHESRW